MKSNWAPKPPAADEIKIFDNDGKATKLEENKCFAALSCIIKNLMRPRLPNLISQYYGT